MWLRRGCRRSWRSCLPPSTGPRGRSRASCQRHGGQQRGGGWGVAGCLGSAAGSLPARLACQRLPHCLSAPPSPPPPHTFTSSLPPSPLQEDLRTAFLAFFKVGQPGGKSLKRFDELMQVGGGRWVEGREWCRGLVLAVCWLVCCWQGSTFKRSC